MILPVAFEQRRAALIIGHPGHELRVLGWLRSCRPVVAVLTDGSGSSETGRIELTTDLIESAGSRRSTVYGDLTDRRIYAAILAGEFELFLGLSGRLADWLLEEEVDLVASDAVEGYNPTHDLCAAVAGRAARLASRASGRPIAHFTFLLTGPPTLSVPPAEAVVLTLDRGALADKLSEARRYAVLAGGALVSEVDAMIGEYGEAGFVSEFFVPATLAEDFSSFAHCAPFYETHGQNQVAAGRYQDVIRYRDHVEPIIEALAT